MPFPQSSRSPGWNRKDTMHIAMDERSLLRAGEPQQCLARVIFHHQHLTLASIANWLHFTVALARNYNVIMFNCYWFARTIWQGLIGTKGRRGLEFERVGAGPIKDVIKIIESRSERKWINPTGALYSAIKFTRARLIEHVAKSINLVAAGFTVVAVGILSHNPTIGWIRFSRDWQGKLHGELSSRGAMAEERWNEHR
ncbi:hypothetical protein HWV62_9617 [Athelia sp. TMB]|nr:hypothetical protein HWV62_9617 [Athelia sp. TMB]